jgi:hypothetical protein
MIGIRIGARPEPIRGLAFTLFYQYKDRVLADGGVCEAYVCAIAKLKFL